MAARMRMPAAVGVTALMMISLCLFPLASQENRVVSEGPRENAPGTGPIAASAYEEAVEEAAGQIAGRAEAAPLNMAGAGAYRLSVASTPAVPSTAREREEGDGEPSAAPAAAAVPPAAPQDFRASYNPLNGRVDCSWSPVSAPDLREYRVYRWRDDDYSGLMNVFYQLSKMDPTVTPYLNSLYAKVEVMLDSPGLTFAERQAMLDSMETELDALNAALCTNPAAAGLLSQAKNLADRYTVRSGASWSDTGTSANRYYWYAVVARNASGQESPYSHSEVLLAVRDDGRAPAAPTGISATAYDPGVALAWSRNRETDLAGYNLYRQQGGSWVKLNVSPVTMGTEYFWETGRSGETYGVTAVDVAGRESARSTAVASLSPASTIPAEDPGWTTTGLWTLERYENAGRQKILLVANDAGAAASHTFYGRRLKVMVSTYWSCGQARIYVDGVPRGTYDLSSPSTVWGVNIFTVTGLEKGSHTFTIEALGTGGLEGFHFVNVEYIEAR